MNNLVENLNLEFVMLKFFLQKNQNIGENG